MTSPIDKSDLPLFNTTLLPQEEMLEVKQNHKKLVIGIPKELSKFENRIALTPQGVEILVENGHTIILETKAGEASNYTDQQYTESGAFIVHSHEDAFECDVLLKVSPLTSKEIDLVKPCQTIISLVQLQQQSRTQIMRLMNKKVNAIGFELIKDEYDSYPILRSMGEIEGYASVMIASEYLSKAHNGKGVFLGGITGIAPAEVIILGAGTAGENAARAALGLGATVKVFDNSYKRLRALELNIGQKIFTSVLSTKVLTKALKTAEVVIGNLRYLQSPLSYMVSEEQVMQMKPGSVIIDLSMGQGGCFETSICTDFSHPVFKKYNVIHYCVPNVASHVARTASIALSNIFNQFLLTMGRSNNIDKLLKENRDICNGLYLYKGILTNHYMGDFFSLPSKDIDLLKAAF